MSSPLAAALALGAAHGLPVAEPVLLKDGSNLLVHLHPAPVVVRVATFTAFIRGEPAPFLEREVALGSYLAEVGAAVVPCSGELPPGPHHVSGWWMTAWQHVPHRVGVRPPADQLLQSLVELHGALAGYAGELPLLGPATTDLDLALACCEQHGLLPATQVEHMLGERDALLASVRSLPATAQHGDAHPGNVLLTEQGVVWNDFEDCCLGSPLWDLATLARHDQTGAVWAVARDRFGGDVVEAMLGLRELQVAAWTALHGARAAGRL